MLLCTAGRVGSAFAAELGTMQVSEQTDSLRVLGTDPVDYLVSPRVLACMIAGPVLNIMCFAMGELKLLHVVTCVFASLAYAKKHFCAFCTSVAAAAIKYHRLCFESVPTASLSIAQRHDVTAAAVTCRAVYWPCCAAGICLLCTSLLAALELSVEEIWVVAKQTAHALQVWLPVWVWLKQCTVFQPMSYWIRPAEPSHHGIL